MTLIISIMILILVTLTFIIILTLMALVNFIITLVLVSLDLPSLLWLMFVHWLHAGPTHPQIGIILCYAKFNPVTEISSTDEIWWMSSSYLKEIHIFTDFMLSQPKHGTEIMLLNVKSTQLLTIIMILLYTPKPTIGQKCWLRWKSDLTIKENTQFSCWSIVA